jgi:hypothetical protein
MSDPCKEAALAYVRSIPDYDNLPYADFVVIEALAFIEAQETVERNG